MCVWNYLDYITEKGDFAVVGRRAMTVLMPVFVDQEMLPGKRRRSAGQVRVARIFSSHYKGECLCGIL
jgi:hypothetical protein